MAQRGSCWSVTINNPCPADEENISLARQKGWTVDGQLEKGKNGTPHYQLIVKTGQVRFSALKKAFPRAHIELARNSTALEQYVHKEETRVDGLKEESDKYPSLQKLWDLFANYIQDTGQHHVFIDASADKRLVIFDKCICQLIDEGYVVETLAVNPQIRSSIKQYGENIYFRSLRRQTDRQTDEEIVECDDKDGSVTFQAQTTWRGVASGSSSQVSSEDASSTSSSGSTYSL